jgi:hypothetical protein
MFPFELQNLLSEKHASKKDGAIWVTTDGTSRILIRNWKKTAAAIGCASARQFQLDANTYGFRTKQTAKHRDLYLWDPTQTFVESTWETTVLALTPLPRQQRRHRTPSERAAGPYGRLTSRSSLWKRLDVLFDAAVAVWETDNDDLSVVRILDWHDAVRQFLPGVTTGALQRLAQRHGLQTSSVDTDIVLCDLTRQFTEEAWRAWKGAVRYEPVGHGSVRYEPVRCQPIRYEPVRCESVDCEPVCCESVDYEPVDVDKIWATLDAVDAGSSCQGDE